jgi:hypothetical protein
MVNDSDSLLRPTLKRLAMLRHRAASWHGGQLLLFLGVLALAAAAGRGLTRAADGIRAQAQSALTESTNEAKPDTPRPEGYFFLAECYSFDEVCKLERSTGIPRILIEKNVALIREAVREPMFRAYTLLATSSELRSSDSALVDSTLAAWRVGEAQRVARARARLSGVRIDAGFGSAGAVFCLLVGYMMMVVATAIAFDLAWRWFGARASPPPNSHK